MTTEQQQTTQVEKQSPDLSTAPEGEKKFVDERLGQKHKRSGGPKTEEGKAKAAMNSLKHGAYAVTTPDLKEYYEIRVSVQRELKPDGVIEDRLADNVAHNIQKAQFLQDYERRMITASQSRPLSAADVAARCCFPFDESYQNLLTKPINVVTLQQELAQAWESHARPPRGKANEVECLPDSRVSALFNQGVATLNERGLVPYLEEDFFNKLDVVMAEALDGSNYLGKRIVKRGDRRMLVNYWLFRNADIVRDCINDVLAERGLAAITDEKLQRARGTLDSGLKNDLESLNTLRQAKSKTVNASRMR